MNILILGASGRVGTELAKLALQDGHIVTALVRNRVKLHIPEQDNLRIHTGNVLEGDSLTKALTRQDVVFSTLSTDKNDVLSRSIPMIINEMERLGIERLITIGTAGILQARSEPHLYRFQSNESKRKSTTAAEDHLHAFEALKRSPINWTVFCPTYLPDGEATGNIRYELDVLPEDGFRITVGDTALFTYENWDRSEFFRRRVGLAE
ncbi:NAD(P)H-binding protein [Bacillus shivajii]|uniref:NAD(P)-dependent oxidoreductase n=1 Tax=Bacillus shivajii TaxID=1983719 RepID=UPI001CF985A8|nr:NAD(P)H-binding protein [Bacillus shivajii]UCZ54274.1 NAD(P)H-binding protein [Bacillus shivajii]